MRYAPVTALASLLLLTSSALAGVQTEPLEGGARFRVTFRHQPVIACEKVSLAGSWNGWSKDALPMRDPDGDGTFEAVVELPRGRHLYKFVINGEVWAHDGDNTRNEPDGHSGYNSILDLGNADAAASGTAGDGVIAMNELMHDAQDLAHAAAVDGRRRLVLRVHVLKDDVESVKVEVSPRPREGAEVAARRIATVGGRDVWEARVSWPRNPQRVRYSFLLADGKEKTSFPAGREKFALAMTEAGRFETPDWVRDAIFYQIFPDRFRDGDPNNQPALPPRPAGQPWHIDDRFFDAWGAEPTHFNMLGGDLAGITEKADYLRDLGMNTIYLNPIFAAGSNHRYDASDYERIDPALGTDKDLKALREALAARDMRFILDCVFNHTGDTHYAFRDCMEKGPQSRYWSWFFFEGFPVRQSPKPNYKGWWGFAHLPQLNTANPEVIEHLMGVGTRWLRDGAAGWRLDVPNEVDVVNPEFWPEFRRRVRRQDPEAYIVGEIWTDAREWLRGDKFDAVMNYPIRSAALEFICKDRPISAGAFASNLSQQLATYPEPALRVQFNLLGSHDTPRIRTLAGGDARKVRLSMTFLFAWPGAPVVYYGDEVGLEGGKDPECRRAFPWDEARQDRTTLEHVRRIAHARQEQPALRRGTVRFLLADGRVCAFVREPETGDPGKPVICVLNASGETRPVRVPLGELRGTPRDLLQGRAVEQADGALVVQLGPFEGAYLVLE